MTSFVLDASVALRWFLDPEVPGYAAATLASIQAGAVAIVPGLWRLEMLNGILIANRRRLLPEAAANLAIAQIERLGAQLRSAARDAALPSLAAAAREHGLTAYDAVYLALARRLSLPLATLDAALRRAATAAGIALFAPA